MQVAPGEAAGGSAEHGGQTFWFCNPGCRRKFVANPARYLTEESAHAPRSITAAASALHTCPMHPEIRQQGPGSCPKCGMALEPVAVAPPATRTEYVCPMHPQIVRSEPGSCPICGMALEPRTVTGVEDNAELRDMTRRFWISTTISVPLLALAIDDMVPGAPLRHIMSARLMAWAQLLLATPVVLWGGWPFFVRGWASLVNRSLNMFTLIALGVGMAYT